MQVGEEQLEAAGLAVATKPASTSAHAAMEEQELLEVSEGFMLDVLAALADMALRSKRRQADLDAALRHAQVEADRPWRLAALERLRVQGFVDKVVELSDGGFLLSVTAFGLDRLGGIRAR